MDTIVERMKVCFDLNVVVPEFFIKIKNRLITKYAFNTLCKKNQKFDANITTEI